jgi:hypothetical protein
MPKLMVELEYEQIDKIVIKELETAISYALKKDKWKHKDDIKYDKKLLPALKTVYRYYAGEEQFEKLKEKINADS